MLTDMNLVGNSRQETYDIEAAENIQDALKD